MSLTHHVHEALNRHDRIALQFSGGKDSSALLWLLRAHWGRLTVYWLNSGDPLPDAAEWIELVRKMVPAFVEVASPKDAVQREYGLPSDLVASESTEFGRFIGSGAAPVQDRLQCCYRSIMEPLHRRMAEDGITLILRGQKSTDPLKPPLVSGMTVDGHELCYPLEKWTDAQVLAYLRNNGLPVLSAYDYGASLPECATCPAWLDERRARFLVEQYPAIAARYRANLRVVAGAAQPTIDRLHSELAMLAALKD